MKLPPTRTAICFPSMLSVGCHSHCAGGLRLFWTASSMWPGPWLLGFASTGADVIVKPPAFGRPGMKVSTHCPAENFTGDMLV